MYRSTATRAQLSRLRDDDRGATAVEYGLIVALIAGVIIGTVAVLGSNLAAAFTSLVGAF